MAANMRVKPGQLASTISDIIRTYSDDLVHDLPELVKEVADDTIKNLQQNASVFGGKKYKKSFKKKKIASVSMSGTSYTVYSSEYRLTHLLEFGHVSKNQHGGPYGVVPGHAHWAPAEEQAIEDLEQKITERIEQG